MKRSTAAALDWRVPSVFPVRGLGVALLLSLVLFVLWNAVSLEVDPARVARGLHRAGIVFGKAVPPSFARWELLVEGVLESLRMATLATACGVLLGIPVAVMAARNLVPLPVYAAGRAIIALGRTFHEIIVAIVFVKAVGFGALAGMLTLTWGSIGFFAKLLAETIENIDRGPLEAVRATGASRGQVLIYGVVPQVLPRLVGLTVYQWDIHLRQSTIVGLVGAGGIGATLYNAFARYDYDFALAILLVIVAIVLAGEVVSAAIRTRIQ